MSQGEPIEAQRRWNSNLHALERLLETAVPTQARHGLDVGCGEGETARDQQTALCRLASLVAPGGVLLIVGLARSRTVSDYAYDVRDAIAIRRHTLTKHVWHTSAPMVWPPPLSWSGARQSALDVLPAASFRRVPYFRYGLTWVKPRSVESS